VGAGDNKAVVRQFMEARFSDREAARRLMAKDATWFIPGDLPLSGLYRNRDEIFDMYLATHTNDFETITSTVDDIIAEGDRVVVEYSASGRTIKGRDYATTYYYVFTLRDGVIWKVAQALDTQYAQRVIYDD
jgi:ketosteroid isomerase-like protein